MIILGLGSNMGDRCASLQMAVDRLGGILQNIRVSRVLESKAVLPPGAPASWNLPFLNMAVSGESTMGPHELFAKTKQIEKELGRKPRDHWAPREIDIDFLAMDGLVVSEADLHIPHPELLNRDFALLPLAELAPQWIYPAPGPHYGQAAAQIVAAKGFCLNPALSDQGMLVHA